MSSEDETSAQYIEQLSKKLAGVRKRKGAGQQEKTVSKHCFSFLTYICEIHYFVNVFFTEACFLLKLVFYILLRALRVFTFFLLVERPNRRCKKERRMQKKLPKQQFPNTSVLAV